MLPAPDLSVHRHACTVENSDPKVENDVLQDRRSIVSPESGRVSGSPTLAQQAVLRSVAGRRAAAEDEVNRLVEAAFALVERDVTFNPKMREILKQAGLSTQTFYRHFRSKDELLLVLLDNGRRRLVSYLGHRMSKARTPEGEIRAWIEGVLAQLTDPVAAARTRPFLVHQDHLAEKFPEEQRASVELLLELLLPPLERLGGGGARAAQRRDALAIYHLTFGLMRQHAIDRTAPTEAETAHVVAFTLAGASSTHTRPKGALTRDYRQGRD
jgi:AcrR family transcriptional regulator